jgi:hypothetical protein
MGGRRWERESLSRLTPKQEEEEGGGKKSREGGEVSEFVQFNFPGVVASVVGLNEVIVGLEHFEFVEELFRGIGFAEFGHPIDESIFVVGGSKSNSNQ